MRLNKTLLLALLLPPLLQGCAAVAVGGAAAVAHDRRSTGAVLDDQTLEVKVKDRIYSDPGIGEESHIKVEVYKRVALLMGETDSEERRALAGRLAGEVQHVENVVNEVAVKEVAGVGTRFNNSWLTAKVNTSLMTNNPVPGFDPTRIKVITSDGTVYLMGLVSRTEGEAVAEVARNVSGVQKVVKVFNYTE
jgi:osmotically-inducible protein OsmY